MGKVYGNRQEILDAIDELRARWPAHSIKPGMVAELEELEEQLAKFTEDNPDKPNK